MSDRLLVLTLTSAFFLTSCDGQPQELTEKPSADDFCKQTDAFCSEARGYAVEPDEHVRYAPNAKGQSAPEVFDFVSSFAWKREFETSDEYKNRISQLTDKIKTRFGETIVFRPEMISAQYDADHSELNFDLSPDVRLEVGRGGHGHDWFVTVGSQCTNLVNVKMERADARLLLEKIRQKPGTYEIEAATYMVGHLDFKLSTSNALAEELGWGFYQDRNFLPQGEYDEIPFVASRLDIVELSTGRKLKSFDCKS